MNSIIYRDWLHILLSLAEARRRGFIVIGDIKRSDIGSTSAAYATGHLGQAPDGIPEDQLLSVDAVTLNPYLGSDSLLPFIKACTEQHKGVYVLVRTSKPLIL